MRYQNLLEIPSFDDWTDIVKKLPNDKTPGPSKVSNEMLKQLGPISVKFLYK